MGSMYRSKGIIHIDITETREGSAKGSNVFGSGRNLGAILALDRTLLLQVKSQILQDENGNSFLGSFVEINIRRE